MKVRDAQIWKTDSKYLDMHTVSPKDSGYVKILHQPVHFLHLLLIHCKKKVSGIPLPSWDVTNQTLPSG